MGFVDELQFPIVAHLPGEPLGDFKRETLIDGAARLTLLVANEGAPGGNFLTLAVLFECGAFAIDAPDGLIRGAVWVVVIRFFVFLFLND